MKDFTIIAAMDKNRGIGKDNKMPWHLSADLKHFAKTSKGGAVIMGRKTWESIPDKWRPFGERLNIVLSHNRDYKLPEGVLLADSLEQALKLAEQNQQPVKEAFVIGGANLFAQAITHPACTKLILTEIQGEYKVDSRFPEIPARFQKTEESELQEENGLRFKFITFTG